MYSSLYPFSEVVISEMFQSTDRRLNIILQFKAFVGRELLPE